MNNFFTILYEGTDFSKKLKDYGTSSVSLELQVGEYIHIGYEKPFKQFFVELETKNTNSNIISAEYYDGTTWQPLDSLLDESEGFTKSGFFFFEKPSTWAKTTVSTIKKFYVRLKTDANHSVGTLVQGLAILLSNDLDLEGVRSNIVSKHNNGASWVLKHEQARKEFIQILRNKGNRIIKNLNNTNPLATEGIRFADVTEFDLLEPEQLRQAAMYKVLSMIYLDELSDEDGDKWEKRGYKYEGSSSKMLNLFSLSIDTDNDGLEDDSENAATTHTVLSWQ